MSKPTVCIISDVRGWAWDRKATAVATNLSDEFEVKVIYMTEGEMPEPGFDLYHTWEMTQVGNLKSKGIVPGHKFVTGICSHTWPTFELPVGQHTFARGPGAVRAMASGARAFHTNSVLLYYDMKQYLGSGVHPNVRYCPNGVDPEIWKRTRPRKIHDPIRAGFVGKPTARKGAHLIREACEKAGVEYAGVERKSKNALTTEEMLDYYQDLDVLLVASDMDGTPNPMLEAACCEVPTIANQVGNSPEFILHGYNGLLINPRSNRTNEHTGHPRPQQPDVDDLVLAIENIKKIDLLEMGWNARQRVLSGWTWAHNAEYYRSMWKDALCES
jgi:glycosyltransferase involved in cell wall biosynthesis